MIFCHLGLAGGVGDICRSWTLFRDYYMEVLAQFQKQHTFTRNKLTRLKHKIFVIDASLVSLCLSLFDWAQYRSRKGTVKLDLMLDYDGCLPVFADLTSEKVQEVTVAKEQKSSKGSILVSDQA
jgi:plasmid maintenance system killer protein